MKEFNPRFSILLVNTVVTNLLLIHLLDAYGEVNTSALMDSLFTSYHSEVYPVCVANTAVQVKVGLALRQIIELV